MDFERLGDVLKDARTKAGYTQSDVAFVLGVTSATVSSWERGKSKMDIDTFIKLCSRYGIDPIYALELSNSEDEQTKDAEMPPLSFNEQELISQFRDLNSDGQTVLLEQARIMGNMPAYKKCDTSSSLA